MNVYAPPDLSVCGVRAVANMFPSLFKAVVADVPFVDVTNTMSDPTIPLTVTEWEEVHNHTDHIQNHNLIIIYMCVCMYDYLSVGQLQRGEVLRVHAELLAI
jgi:hypothetical protein